MRASEASLEVLRITRQRQVFGGITRYRALGGVLIEVLNDGIAATRFDVVDEVVGDVCAHRVVAEAVELFAERFGFGVPDVLIETAIDRVPLTEVHQRRGAALEP